MKSKILTLTMLLTCSLSFSSNNWHHCTYIRNLNDCRQNSYRGCVWDQSRDLRTGQALAMCAYNKAYDQTLNPDYGTMAYLGFPRIKK
jgi:hypothetical protein